MMGLSKSQPDVENSTLVAFGPQFQAQDKDKRKETWHEVCKKPGHAKDIDMTNY